jgi:isoquinoline 1-oxidoreductase subunit beta
MMEAADHGCLDDAAFGKALHPSSLRGVLLQGKLRSGAVVVEEIVAQQATQVDLVEHDHLVEALARITDMPQIAVYVVPSADPPTGMGEPGLPPLAPAFANAIARLTGKPLRQLPFNLA